MPTTPDLGITHWTPNQANPDVTGNTAIDSLDIAVAGTAVIDCTAGGTIVATAMASDGYVNWLHERLFLDGTPGAGFTLQLPAKAKRYIIQNETGKTATITNAGGAGNTVTLATGQIQVVYTDNGANNVIPVSGAVIDSTGAITGGVTLSGDVTGPSGSNTISKFNGVPWTAGTGPPGSGTHVAGEIVWNTAPTAGGNAAWICVTGGTPGTWKTMGPIAL